MKKLLFLLLLLPQIAAAQLIPVVDIAYPKFGVMYNHKFANIGTYAVVQYAHKNTELFDTDNAKLGLGVSLPYDGDALVFYAGLNYQTFWNVRDDSPFVDLGAVQPLSFDIGISRGIDGFMMLFLVDLINADYAIGCSYKFGYRKKLMLQPLLL